MRNKKTISIILFLALMLSVVPNSTSGAKTKLNVTKKTLTVGKSITIKITDAKSVKWSVSNKKIKITKSANSYAKVKAVKVGTANLVAKVSKKSYKCKFTIKNVSSNNTPESANTPMPIPTSEPPQEIVKPTDTPAPSQTLTPTTTPYATETSVPTVDPTKEPEVTPIPTDTPTPVMTIEPFATPSPTITARPTDTPEPSLEPIPTPAEYVYITATGSKYHRSSACSNMKNPQKVKLSEAVSDGYTKCSKCW